MLAAWPLSSKRQGNVVPLFGWIENQRYVVNDVNACHTRNKVYLNMLEYFVISDPCKICVKCQYSYLKWFKYISKISSSSWTECKNAIETILSFLNILGLSIYFYNTFVEYRIALKNKWKWGTDCFNNFVTLKHYSLLRQNQRIKWHGNLDRKTFCLGNHELFLEG